MLRQSLYSKNRSTGVQGYFNTYPSSPVASTYQDLPEDTHEWNCTQWIEYYKRNKTALGQDQAVYIISSDMESNGPFSDLASCKYDCNFMNYMRSEGVPIESAWSDIYCSVTDVVKVATTTTKTLADVMKILLPIGIVVGVGYIGYTALQKTK